MACEVISYRVGGFDPARNMPPRSGIRESPFKWYTRLVETLATIQISTPLPLPNPHQNTTQHCISLIKQHTSTKHLHQIHAYALRHGHGLYQPHLWNTLIRAYTSNGAPHHALRVYPHMPAKDKFTFPITFKACSLLSAFYEGACIHAHLLKLGFASDVYSLNSLLYLYCKCGRLEAARRVFDRIPERSVASWSTMIAGYDHNGEANKALQVFVQMRVDDALVDDMALVSVVSACTECGCLKLGESVHAHAIVNGILSIELSTAFVDMYAKCGAISTSREVFNRMPEKNVLSWSAMIGGLAMHGSGKEALALFNDMLDAGVKPNSITFTHILSACGQNGMVDEGQRYFNCMKDEYWIKPRIEHYGCMVDLLSRAGLLDQALDFIAKMPIEPTEALWRSLLGSACTHGNLEIGELAMNHLAKLEPIAGDYVTLANLYAQKHQWDKVGKVRNMMCDLGVKKVPGYSLIEVNGVTHKFVVWDRYHPQTPHIYDMLGVIHGEMSASWDQ